MKINKTMLLAALTAIAIPVSAMQRNEQKVVNPSLSRSESAAVNNVTQAVAELHNAMANSSTAKAAATTAIAGGNRSVITKANNLLVAANTAVANAVTDVKQAIVPKALVTSAAKKAANLPLANKAITEADESQSSSRTLIAKAKDMSKKAYETSRKTPETVMTYSPVRN
jgi:hypothetical protein